MVQGSCTAVTMLRLPGVVVLALHEIDGELETSVETTTSRGVVPCVWGAERSAAAARSSCATSMRPTDAPGSGGANASSARVVPWGSSNSANCSLSNCSSLVSDCGPMALPTTVGGAPDSTLPCSRWARTCAGTRQV